MRGVKVLQNGRGYIAKEWRLLPDVVFAIETVLDAGLTCMIRDSHPQKGRLLPEGEGVVHFGFSKHPEQRWMLVFNQKTRQQDMTQFTVQKRFADALTAAGVPFAPEWGSSKELEVEMGHLARVVQVLSQHGG